MKTFSVADFDPKSVYGRVQSFIGLEGRRLIRLILVIVLPLLLLSAATFGEKCFSLRSVLTEGSLDGKALKLVGMSFVGDPMVWGYTILVPILVIVLKLATGRTLDLVNAVASKATPGWKGDPSPQGFAAVTQETKAIWGMRARRPRGITAAFRYGPWVVALWFWGYNTLTCGLHPYVDSVTYPYRSKLVKVIPTGKEVVTNSPSSTIPSTSTNSLSSTDSNRAPVLEFTFEARPGVVALAETNNPVQQLTLASPVSLGKWDCRPQMAPFSCWLTRIWTLPFYGVIPFLLRHLLLLIWGATHFLAASIRWEHQAGHEDVPAIEINPFHPDGFGGLGVLSDAVIGYLYSISCFTMLLGLAFLKEGNEPSWHNYALMTAFVPVGLWAIFAPSFAVRHTIVNAKERYLGQLATELNTLGNAILLALPTGTLAKDLRERELDKQHKAVKGIYDEVQRMSEWPFSTVTLMRMAFPIAAPWLPAVLKELAGVLLNN